MPLFRRPRKKKSRAELYEEHTRDYANARGFKWWWPTTNRYKLEEGYKLHITSGHPENAPEVVRVAGEILKREQVAHKVVPDMEKLKRQLNNYQAGKLMTVYPRNNQELVRVATAIDKELISRGLTHESPIGTPLTSRRIGQSGLVHYRYGPEDFVFTKGYSFFDPKVGKYRTGEVPDRRTPGLHDPSLGPDPIEKLAKTTGLPVEPIDDFLWRVGAHAEDLLKRNKASGDRERVMVLQEKLNGFRAVVDQHESSEAPTMDYTVISKERNQEVRERFRRLYADIRKGGPVTSRKGQVHTPSYMIEQIRKNYEQPLIYGVPIDRSNKPHLYITDQGYRPRSLLKKALRDLGETP